MGLGRVMKVHGAFLSPIRVFPCSPCGCPAVPECSGDVPGRKADRLLIVCGSPAGVASEAQARKGSRLSPEGQIRRPKHGRKG